MVMLGQLCWRSRRLERSGTRLHYLGLAVRRVAPFFAIVVTVAVVGVVWSSNPDSSLTIEAADFDEPTAAPEFEPQRESLAVKPQLRVTTTTGAAPATSVEVASATSVEVAPATSVEVSSNGGVSPDLPDPEKSTVVAETSSTATSTPQSSSVSASAPTTTETRTTAETRTTELASSSLRPSDSVAYVGVSAARWAEIDAQRSDFGDPNDCRARVGSIANQQATVVPSGDSAALRRALASSSKVIRLEGGTYSISSTILLADGRQLIGASGADVTINAAGVRDAVKLNSGSVLANLAVRNAEDRGIILGNDNLVYQVSIGRTGYGATSNSLGTGLSISGQVSGQGSNNCVVSTEAFEGFNEDGAGCGSCANGGNADGFGATFGAKFNTFIDAFSYRNSDDGFDFWEGGTSFVYFSSASENGKIPGRQGADGNGFKLGQGSSTHYVFESEAINNKRTGFDLNNNSASPVLINTTATSNGTFNYLNLSNLGNGTS